MGLVAAWQSKRLDLEPHLVSPAAGSAMERAALAAGWSVSDAPYGGWVSFSHRESQARRRLERARSRDDVNAVARVIERIRPALVIVNTVVTPWAAIAAHDHGVPVAWFLREFVDDRPGFRLREGREQTLRYVDALADVVIANSDAVRSSIADVIPAARVKVAHPVIDRFAVQAAIEHRRTDAESHAPLRIGVVGRVTPEKGHRVAVEALAALHERGILAELHLIGGVILRGFDHELRRLAHHRGVADRLHFVGEKRRPLDHLAATHVSLVPSPREAFGRVNLESLALGLPVVASDSGGATELIEHDGNGYLVDAKNPEAVADALARYALDRELLARHGMAAQQRAAEIIDGPHGAAATIAVLEHLIAVPPTRTRGGAGAGHALLTGSRALKPGERAALQILDRFSTAAQRLNRLVRDPRTPLRRRWVALSGRARQRARRG
ncbi:glycosyltransferase family 4 protein [Microcella sp.]|uniref:glycosyltransferase family 4 protein n=1 Tax=Microcella sp. TaxID=1913979 RepID=UPI003F70362F